MMTCNSCGEVGHTRNRCPNLNDNTSQVGHFAHAIYALEGRVPSGFRSVLMSDEEFEKYQIFQQFQATQKTLSSFTVTLA